MARKKNQKALFEVLSRGKGSMKVPDWAKKSSVSPGQPAPDELDEQAEEITPTEPIDAADESIPEEPIEETQLESVETPPAEPVEEDVIEEQAELEAEVDELESEPDETLEVQDEVEQEEAEEEEIEEEFEPEDQLELDEDEVEEVEEIDEEDLGPEDIQEVEEEDSDDFEEESEEELVEDLEAEEAEDSDDEVEAEENLEEDEVEPEDVEVSEVFEEEEEDEAEIQDDQEGEIEEAEETGEEEELQQAEYLQDVAEEPAQAANAPVPLTEEEVERRYQSMANGGRQAISGVGVRETSAGSMIKIAGDRIRLSVNYVTAGVVVLIIFTLLLAAYVIGKKTGGSPAGDGQSAAGVGHEASGHVAAPPALPGSDTIISEVQDGPVEAMPGKRDPNRYYLIIETLKGKTSEDYDDAEEIINFCAARGLPAEMVQIQGRFAVWCLLGFRSRTSTAAIEHARQVERVGEEFFEKKKTYRFMQRNKRGGELIPFFKRGAYRK